MRFFASWWERLPVRAAIRSTFTLAVAGGLVGLLPRIISHVLGNYWS